MEEYKSNSHRYRESQNQPTEDKKKVEKVVKGGVKTKKKTELRKFTDVFISEDVHNVKSYVVLDVLVPAIKKAVSDIVTNGIDMILYGSSGVRKNRNTSGSKVSYGKYYERSDDRRPVSDSRSRSRFDYDDIIIESRGEAEAVLDQLYEIINKYGFATVLDLYDTCDLTAPYTADKYGWTSLRGSSVERVHGGYMIKLPKAMPID